MSKVFFDVGVSLDGYIAGRNRGPNNPLGEAGVSIHKWGFETAHFRENGRIRDGQAGLLDEFTLHIAPMLLGRGVRLLDHLNPADLQREQLEVNKSPLATHVRYRVMLPPSSGQ